jgi:urea transport system permease protein
MFSLQVGFMSPSFVGIVPSVEMVIFAAVGGRMSLVGAVYGALLVNAGKTFFSESFPDLWLFLMAALFIGVTMAFPMGLAGLWESQVTPRWNKWRSERATRSTTIKQRPPAGPPQGKADAPLGGRSESDVGAASKSAATWGLQ